MSNLHRPPDSLYGLPPDYDDFHATCVTLAMHHVTAETPVDGTYALGLKRADWNISVYPTENILGPGHDKRAIIEHTRAYDGGCGKLIGERVIRWTIDEDFEHRFNLIKTLTYPDQIARTHRPTRDDDRVITLRERRRREVALLLPIKPASIHERIQEVVTSLLVDEDEGRLYLNDLPADVCSRVEEPKRLLSPR